MSGLLGTGLVDSPVEWGEGRQKLLPSCYGWQLSKTVQSQGFRHPQIEKFVELRSRIFFPPHYWYQQPSPEKPDFQVPFCIPRHYHCSHRSNLSIPSPPNTHGAIEYTCHPHLKDKGIVAQEGCECLPGSRSELTGEIEFKFGDPIKVLSPLPSEPTTQGTPLGVT